MALKIVGVKNKLFENSKETGEGFENKKNPPQNIANKINYWICSGWQFEEMQLQVIGGQGWTRDATANGHVYIADSLGASPSVKVELPDGARIISAVLYGNDSDLWSFTRVKIDGTAAAETICDGSTNVKTRVENIGTEIVDNKKYVYEIFTPLAQTKAIYGAKVEYETNFT